jgi:hypothetical protein
VITRREIAEALEAEGISSRRPAAVR